MVNIILCEDNIKDRKKTIKIVEEFLKERKVEYKIHVFEDYNDNFENIIKSTLPFKIYLLDIETPSRSGIDVARDIRKNDLDSIIIFLTAHDELSSVVAKDDIMFLTFINKFYNFDKKLPFSLNNALKLLNKKRVIKISDSNISYTIDINSILYICKDSFERKTIIKTDYDEIKVKRTLIEIRKMLDERFIQTHRACYINIDRKSKIDLKNKIITFDNGNEIDLISDRYKKDVI